MKLKRCPKCHGELTVDNGQPGYYWCCYGCGITHGTWLTEKEAIKDANNRAESAWQMFRRLAKEYGSKFLFRLYNSFGSLEALHLKSEPEAIAIMQEIEKEIGK